MKQYVDKFKKLSKPVQIATSVAAVYLIYKTYKLLFANAQETANDKLLSNAQKELNEYSKKYKLSYKPSDYDGYANIIYESTKYGLGDNYGDVVKTMNKMNNDADVAKLITVYGQRQNYIFGIPQGEKRDLFTNIRVELGNEWGGITSYRVDKINDNWKSKGITYKI